MGRPALRTAAAAVLLVMVVAVAAPPVAAWDALGRGLLPFDGLYERRQLKAAVLDLGALTPRTIHGRPQVARSAVAVTPVTTRSESSETGSSFTEFTNKVAASGSVSGGTAAFKASVSAHYKAKAVVSTDTRFARRALRVETAHLWVTTTAVLPGVAAELARLPPAAIFRKYGTHVATRLSAGGYLQVWSSSTKSAFASESSFSATVDASWKKLLKASATLTRDQSAAIRRLSTKEGLLARGGDVRLASGKVDEWVSSLLTTSEEVDFLPDGAVPIWSLIPDRAQANRCRAAYEAVYGAQAMLLKRFASAPLASTPRVPWPEATVYVPSGWKVLSGGAEVKYYGNGQLLTRSRPIIEAGATVGWAAASKDHLESDRGQVRAYAVALWDPYNEWDVIVRVAASRRAPHPRATVTLPPGFLLVGGGGDVQWRGYGNLLVDSYPSSSRSWTATSKDHLRSDPGYVSAFAIGLRSRTWARMPRRRVKTGRYGPVAHPAGSVVASPAYGMVGGGASVSKGGLGNMLTALVPDESGRSFRAGAKDHLKGDHQRLTVYGIEMEGVAFVTNVGDVLGVDLRGGLP